MMCLWGGINLPCLDILELNRQPMILISSELRSIFSEDAVVGWRQLFRKGSPVH